jgi:flavin-dependent dehydrogenase
MRHASGTEAAIVVGGRVAGALTAARLSRQGMAVTVFEAHRFPSDTLSTHFFRGDGLVRGLDELGVLAAVLETGAPRLTCQYVYEDGGRDPERTEPQEPGDLGFSLSVRRVVLDALLASYVANLPRVDLRTGVRVAELVEQDGVVVGVRDSAGDEHRCAVVVGADGRRSSVARLARAGDDRRHLAARIMYYRYVAGWTGPDGSNPDGPEFSFLGNELAYVFPSDHALTCVALSLPLDEVAAPRTREKHFVSRLRRHRGLWDRLERTSPQGPTYFGPAEDSVVRAAAGPGWALVGDAGTHQDPWTGFGLDTAARQSAALAHALAADGEGWGAAYAASRDDVTLDRFSFTVAGAADLRVLAD